MIEEILMPFLHSSFSQLKTIYTNSMYQHLFLLEFMTSKLDLCSSWKCLIFFKVSSLFNSELVPPISIFELWMKMIKVLS